MERMRTPARRKRRLPIGAAIAFAIAILTAGVAGAAGQGPGGLTASIAGVTQGATYTAAKSDSGQLAKTDPALLGQSSDSRPVNVMIKYDFDAAASYTGDVAGLAATSPRVTGKSLTANAAAVSAYNAYTGHRAKTIDAAIARAVPNADVGQTFQTAYGGVEAQVPANSISSLLQVPGVVAVQKDSLQQPLDDNTSLIGATSVWPTIGGSKLAASNVVVGVIDTGVWPENPMFAADPAEPAPPSRSLRITATSATARTRRISDRHSPATTS